MWGYGFDSQMPVDTMKLRPRLPLWQSGALLFQRMMDNLDEGLMDDLDELEPEKEKNDQEPHIMSMTPPKISACGPLRTRVHLK